MGSQPPVIVEKPTQTSAVSLPVRAAVSPTLSALSNAREHPVVAGLVRFSSDGYNKLTRALGPFGDIIVRFSRHSRSSHVVARPLFFDPSLTLLNFFAVLAVLLLYFHLHVRWVFTPWPFFALAPRMSGLCAVDKLQSIFEWRSRKSQWKSRALASLSFQQTNVRQAKDGYYFNYVRIRRQVITRHPHCMVGRGRFVFLWPIPVSGA